MDWALLERPGNKEIQLDLFLDYATNVSFTQISRIFSQIEAAFAGDLGKNDPFFIPPGAEAFQERLTKRKGPVLDTGHFAIETHAEEIAFAMRDFLDKCHTT